MYPKDHLDMLCGTFQKESIRRLQYIFETLADPATSAANRIRLKQTFLSIVEQEQHQGNTPIANSPDGMNFIYCLIETGQCILLNPNGVIPILQNWLIAEGELAIENMRWYEADHLVTFELYHIVHNERQTCIFHFTNDDNAFVYFTETKQSNWFSPWGEDLSAYL